MAEQTPAPPSRPGTAGSVPEPTARRGGSGLRPIARALDRAMPLPARRQAALLARLKLDWSAIVGPELAAVAVPERLGPTRGDALPLLHVRVESAAALEVQHREPQLLARIAQHFGHPVAQGIRLRQGRVAAPARRMAPPPASIPPDAARRIGAAVSGVGDPELADALADLGRAISASIRPDRSR